MKKTVSSLIVLLCAAPLMVACASSTFSIAANFKDIKTAVSEPSHTLLVLDDDDTLTMLPCPDAKNIQTCQYLGGPAWGAWQASLPAGNLMRVSKTMSGIYDVSGLVTAMSGSSYTDADESKVISNLVSHGAKVMVETARAVSEAGATQAQLKGLNIKVGKTQSTLANFINANAPMSKFGLASVSGPFVCKGSAGRTALYQQGVYYVTGQNKGLMLQCLMKQVNMTGITHIVFADDTKQNVIDMAAAFKSSKQYYVIALYYTKLHAHKNALIVGKLSRAYQSQAFRAWQHLKKVLKRNISEPNL